MSENGIWYSERLARCCHPDCDESQFEVIDSDELRQDGWVFKHDKRTNTGIAFCPAHAMCDGAMGVSGYQRDIEESDREPDPMIDVCPWRMAKAIERQEARDGQGGGGDVGPTNTIHRL